VKLYFWLGTIALSAICAVGGIVYHCSEPSFHGQTFTQWVWLMENAKPGTEKEKYRVIVRNLGADHLPMLLKWVRKMDADERPSRLSKLESKVVESLRSLELIPHETVSPSHYVTAERVFAVLDTNSKKFLLPH
jgi:hypothetical protein